jgi:AraC-like DNA-binding protein
LITTDLAISEIAERCGFQSNERLTVNFGAAVGQSPMAYRKGVRAKRG